MRATAAAGRRCKSRKHEEQAMSADKTGVTPSIARIWRGRTIRAKADEYEAYLYENGVKVLAQRALAVQQLREDREHDTEFVTISYWESVEAMSRYAGSDPRRIHHLERDEELLIELPQSVQVLHITAQKGVFGV
jgi:heme-degrading monooxygenase HmoA